MSGSEADGGAMRRRGRARRRPPRVLQGAGLRLRPTTPADLAFVLKAERAADNRPFVTQWSRARHREAARASGGAHLIAERRAGGAPVGYAILAGLDGPHRSIELVRLVITDKGRGHGREVLRLVKRLAFEACGAHRLWLDVKTHNARAIVLYASEGFVREGVLRECLKSGGAYESLIVMSILESEYDPGGKPGAS